MKTIVDKVLYHLEMSDKELCEEIGLNKSVVSVWRKRGISKSGKKFLVDNYGFNLDYLSLGKHPIFEKDRNTNNLEHFSKDALIALLDEKERTIQSMLDQIEMLKAKKDS